MFSHRLAESLLWLQLCESSVIDSSQQRRGGNKSPSLCSDWLLKTTAEDRMRIERERVEEGRASERATFPKFKQRGGGRGGGEEEEKIGGREGGEEEEDEVKCRERSRREIRGWEEEGVKRRRQIEEDEEEELTCTSDSPSGQRQEEVENRRDFVILLCNRRLLHHSILPLRRKLTSVLGCPPPHTVCVCGCARSSQPLFFSVFG